MLKASDGRFWQEMAGFGRGKGRIKNPAISRSVISAGVEGIRPGKTSYQEDGGERDRRVGSQSGFTAFPWEPAPGNSRIEPWLHGNSDPYIIRGW